MKKSVIIIGGGLGGLFTGAILAKEGFQVTLIEKNTTLGGGLQSFKRFGEVFDTGMHVIGGMQPGGNIYRICEYLGIVDKMKIADVDPNCVDRIYFAEDKMFYEIAKGKQGFVDSLSRYFPEQREHLVNYVKAMFRLVDEMDLFHLRPTLANIFRHSAEFMMPADKFIAQYISDRRLRSAVAYMNPLYSGRGNMTPAFVHAVISVLYINGASRFVGGSHLFANLLGDYIREHGGEVILHDGVAHIHSHEREITGVTTHKGRELKADYYISAIHPCTLLSLLDDEKIFPKSYRNRLEMIPNSYSAFTINIKLKAGKIPYMNYTGYYTTEYDKIWRFGDTNIEWPLGFLYMTPPEENQGKYSTKMIITAPMTWNHVKQWEGTTFGHRPKDYEEWKERCANLLLNKMEEIFPGFHSHIEAVNTASPLTIRDFYGVKEGAMCGYSKDANNIAMSQLPVVTKVPNLLLTGQNNNLHGFCGVPLTAINTCEALLGHNYLINKFNHQ